MKKTLLCSIAVLWALAANGQQVESPCEVNCRLMKLSADVRDYRLPGLRGQAAADLAYAAAASSPADAGAVSDKTVDSISALLKDDDPIVKMYSALALGELNGRANRALPALYEALETYRDPPSEDYILPAVDGRAEILGAIKRVEAAEVGE